MVDLVSAGFALWFWGRPNVEEDADGGSLWTRRECLIGREYLLFNSRRAADWTSIRQEISLDLDTQACLSVYNQSGLVKDIVKCYSLTGTLLALKNSFHIIFEKQNWKKNKFLVKDLKNAFLTISYFGTLNIRVKIKLNGLWNFFSFLIHIENMKHFKRHKLSVPGTDRRGRRKRARDIIV